MMKTEERFKELLEADNTHPGDDVERLQLLYVLARTESLFEELPRIYNVQKHCLKKGWSKVVDGKPSKMLKRAAHMFSPQNEDIPTVELFWGLDSHNTETMVVAQMIYCGMWPFEDEMK